MLLCSKKSRNKILHNEHCGHLNNANSENIISYASIDEALKAGCVPCKHCSNIMKRYRFEEKWIAKYCTNHSIECYPESIGVKVLSADNDEWFIVTHKHKKLALYHKNTYEKKNSTSPIEGYHYQSVTYSSYSEMLKYISHHDEYRKEQLTRKAAKLKEEKRLAKLHNKNRSTQKIKKKSKKNKQSSAQKYRNYIKRINRVDYLFSVIEQDLLKEAV